MLADPISEGVSVVLGAFVALPLIPRRRPIAHVAATPRLDPAATAAVPDPGQPVGEVLSIVDGVVLRLADGRTAGLVEASQTFGLRTGAPATGEAVLVLAAVDTTRGVLMATADEIRARIEAADMARVQARAEAAAKVAERVERRAAIARELADVEAALAADIASAERVMTMSELIDFIGISEAELTAAQTHSGPGKGRGSRRRAAPSARSPRARRAVSSGVTPGAPTAV